MRSPAAVPIKRDGNPIGVLLFYLDQPHALTEETVGLLERMAENVSFALDNFDRDRATTRINRMFAALTATNEAILRAQSADEMFQLVCEAASDHGKLLGAAIFTPEPNSSWFMLAAQAGRYPEITASLRFCADPAIPLGQGMRRHRDSATANPASATTSPMILAQNRGDRWSRRQACKPARSFRCSWIPGRQA